MNLKLKILLILTLFTFTSVKNRSGSDNFKDTQSTLKALYIYNFATLTDWPDSYKKNDFVIAVMSANDFVFKEISKKYNGKSIGGQKIETIRVLSPSSIKTPNILFLDKSSNSLLSSVSSQLKNKSTMFITNRTGALNMGAVINFVEENNKQSYEINVRNAKKKKLVIATKLIELAIKKIE